MVTTVALPGRIPCNTPRCNRIPSSLFDYGLGNLGETQDEVIEDRDTHLEKELDIKIQRCWEVDQFIETPIRDADES